jgi:truncated hemoglobin YjbI
MKFIVLAFILLLASNSQGETICDYYSAALNLTNADLVSFVVAQTVNMSLHSELAVFFNGEVPEGSTDFTDPDNTEAFIHLFDGLVSFFGVALGCTDGSIAPYTGPSLADAHAGMPITSDDFELFNSFIIEIMGAAGVIEADLETVGGVLESTRLDVCTECPPPTICDYYSHALGLTNLELVAFVVNETVIAALSSDLVVFFNGEVPEGSTNFADPLNLESFIHLFQGLVNFFGVALGCTDGSIPPYTGPSLADAHAGMPINATQFEQFNGFIIDILDAAGVVDEDLDTVAAVLESTRIDICNDCPPPSICDYYSHALD